MNIGATIDPEIVRQIHEAVDKRLFRSYSHAIEEYLRVGILKYKKR